MNNYFSKISWYFLGVIIIAAIFRIAFLDKVPVGLSNDELDYVLNAKAVFLQRSDISNTWNPLSLTTPTSGFPQAEILPLITFLFIGPLPLSLFYSKLVYAVISIGIVGILFLITKRLIGEKEALFVGIVASFNPWLLFFGRTAYDAPSAVFFYLFGIYVLLKAKGWKVLLSFPLFFIGFYSYIGTKILLIPIVLLSVFFSWYFINKKKFTKQYLVLIFLSIALMVYFLVNLLNANSTRISEISTPDMPQIAQITNTQRRLSVNSPLSNIFSNKYVVFVNYSIEKYLNVYSPNFLFLHGDNKYLFSLYDHGELFIADSLFIIIGLYFLFLRKRSFAYFLTALILIAPLPAVVSNVEVSYAIRALFLCPLLIILIGYGIYCIIFINKNHTYKIISLVVIVSIYLIQLSIFLNIYFLRNPISNPESFNLSSRILMKYLSFQPANENIFVINGNPEIPFKQYLFYTNSYNSKNLKEVASNYLSKKFNIGNINFISCDQTPDIDSSTIIIYEAGTKCNRVPSGNNHLTIVQLSDSGSIFKIFNDNICNKYKIQRYVSSVSFLDLNVEKLTERNFCEKYIVNYFQ